MREDLVEELRHTCPKLYTHLKWVECSNGWFSLVRELSISIEEEINKLPEEEQDNVYVTQIKEKFGGLRFYMTYANPKIDALIRASEEESIKTCETCGNPGKIRGKGWGYTACDIHTKEQDRILDEESNGE